MLLLSSTWRPWHWIQHRVMVRSHWINEQKGNAWQPRYVNIFLDLQVMRRKGNLPKQPVGSKSYPSASREGRLTEKQWRAGKSGCNLGTRVKSNQHVSNSDCCTTYETQNHTKRICLPFTDYRLYIYTHIHFKKYASGSLENTCNLRIK